MICPYCNGEMVAGKILGDRYDLKWVDNNQKLVMGIWAPPDSIIISTRCHAERHAVDGFMCKACNKLIIDVNNSN